MSSDSVAQELTTRDLFGPGPVRVRPWKGARTHFTFEAWAQAGADMGCVQVSTWCHRDGFPDPHPQTIDVLMDSDCKQCLRLFLEQRPYFPEWDRIGGDSL